MDREICGQCGNPTAFSDSWLTRDEVMHLVNETAPRYQSWGTEAHFQNFAKSLSAIVAAAERNECLAIIKEYLTTARFDPRRHSPEFDKWWEDETSSEPHPTNNYRKDSAAYWAYQGWMYGVAAEREACASVCEAEAEKWEGGDGPICAEARMCAVAIRARGDA